MVKLGTIGWALGISAGFCVTMYFAGPTVKRDIANAAADLNNDGISDVVKYRNGTFPHMHYPALIQEYYANIYVELSDAASGRHKKKTVASFSSMMDYLVVEDVQVRDVDGDGALDILFSVAKEVENRRTIMDYVLKNDGKGNFSVPMPLRSRNR